MVELAQPRRIPRRRRAIVREPGEAFPEPRGTGAHGDAQELGARRPGTGREPAPGDEHREEERRLPHLITMTFICLRNLPESISIRYTPEATVLPSAALPSQPGNPSSPVKA